MSEFNEYKDCFPILSKCHLFSSIPEKSYTDLLKYLHARIKTYKKDEYLLHLGDSFLYANIVLDGTIEGSFLSENYDKININYFHMGRLFGEAFACMQISNSPVQLRAITDCHVLFLDLHKLFEGRCLKCNYQQQLSLNLIQSLATQNVFLNFKLRIVSQKSLRDRIYIYLNSLTPDENGTLHIPFSQTALAEFLGVNRSALSRELGRMQDEELLLIDGKTIRILH